MKEVSMKSIIISLLLAIMLYCNSGRTYTQSNISIQITGGINFPAGNFGQQVPLLDTTRTLWPYQMKTAYSVGARGKIALKKDRKLNLTFGLNYSAFSNNQQVINIYATTGEGSSWTDRSGIGGTATVTFHPKVNIITIAAGIDYNFNPKSKLSPFADAEITANFFSGSFTFDETSQGVYAPVNLTTATRVGLQLAGGVEYRINENWGLLGGLRTNFANLIGKTAPPQDLHTQQIELGDKSGTVYGSSTPSLNIVYINIFVGVQLFLIPPEKQPPGKMGNPK
jgi:opacity protein-like surface antigen